MKYIQKITIRLKNLFLALIALIFLSCSMTACVITHDTRTIQIEIMKPGIINSPENANTVALINNVLDDQPFEYISKLSYVGDTIIDSTITYRALSNTCIDALAFELEKEGYFSKVINYQDSLNNINLMNKDLFDPERLFKKTESDLCILLDDYSFHIEKLKYLKSITNKVSLSWIIAFKSDTLSYNYKQRDTLTFATDDIPLGLAENLKIKLVVYNSARYLGKSFCSKIIPTWIQVDRFYYTSKNRNMVQAEKFALNNDWLKAAEIWKMQTKSKNHLMVAKATYNMAIACEMEGNPDAALDWLVRSFSVLKKNNEDHKANCKQYINVLTLRKKEIEKLSQQVRN